MSESEIKCWMDRLKVLGDLQDQDPRDADIRYMVGRCYSELAALGHNTYPNTTENLLIQAIGAYTEAIGLEATYLHAYYHKAQALLALGYPALARKAAEAGQAVLQSMPENPDKLSFVELLKTIAEAEK